MHSIRGVMVGLAVMITLALGVLGTFAAGYGQGASGVKTEVATALTHAGFAAKYDTMKEVTLHLHHVVNCLVGPKDKMFDSSAGNPCDGQGNGALVDIKASMGEDAAFNQAWWAANVAQQAIMTNNLAQEKSGAHVIILILTDLQNMK